MNVTFRYELFEDPGLSLTQSKDQSVVHGEVQGEGCRTCKRGGRVLEKREGNGSTRLLVFSLIQCGPLSAF